MLVHPPALSFGHPLPYGAIVHEGGVQFVVFSRSATAMRLLLYRSTADPDPTDIIPLDPEQNRWGDIWSVFVPGVAPDSFIIFRRTVRPTPTTGCSSMARPG